MPAADRGKPPDVAAPPSSSLLPPAVARVRSDAAWDGQSKGKGRASDCAQSHEQASLARNGAQVPPPPPSQNSDLHQPPSTTSQQQPDSLSTRRLGALGIPLPSDSGSENGDVSPSSTSSSGSLEANPPASPVVPVYHEPPEPTYSRGGSTRSGPSTRSGTQDGGAFVSEQSFRDIVDDLTLQNQKLKARLKRFESARVPSNLRNERLFEVRFFDGLPKQRRREIEGFLTDYVQTLSTTASSGDLLSSSSRVNVSGDVSNHDNTESTSSLGATLRSLRSSEREALGKEALLAAGSGPSAGADRSATGSGSASGSGGRAQKVSRERNAATIEPLGATSSLPLPDPPALLRRPTDIFPPERDVLAAPSFSGAEPLSTMGTGSGMRISDPTSKKRKRAPNTSEEAPSPERVPRARRTASYDGSTSSRDGTPDPERLEFVIVDMIERLFSESLPLDDPDHPHQSIPSPNPLHTEPHPLPAQSSTNTAYLRAMLVADDVQARGGWLYLNLVSTMAALHRLNVSLATVRHALRTKSTLVEVSAEGNKIRWKGPRTKPAPRMQDAAAADAKSTFGMGDMEDNAIEATRMQGVEDAEREQEHRRHVVEGGGRGSSRSSRSSNGVPDSMFDERGGGARSGSGARVAGESGSGRPSKGSTAPTSQYPSMGSKNGSSSQGDKRLSVGHAQAVLEAHDTASKWSPLPPSTRAELAAAPPAPSALRHSVNELHEVPGASSGHDGAHVLGSSVQPAPKHLLYTPLFVRRNDSESEKGSNDDASVASDVSAEDTRPAKRHKEAGGVVYFANPLFYSDLAGDSGARMQALQDRMGDMVAPEAVLGAPSSAVASGSTAPDAASRSRSSLTPLSELGTLDSHSMKLDGVLECAPASTAASDDARSAGSVLEGDLAWDAIEAVDIAPAGPLPANLEDHDVFQITPYPNLQLSGTSDDVTAADHFTTHTKHLYPPLPPRSPRRISALPKRLHSSSASILPPPLSARKHYPTLVASTCISSLTLHHHPSVCVRFPRHRLRMSSTASNSDDGDDVRGSASPTSTQIRRLANAHSGLSGADYLMSLALPLNNWAPELRRGASTEERDTSEAFRTGDSASLITLD
ncbi:uncharacterized protein RHOBADRAFT_51883 [Rhodotorula graminis WP1]|uniref:Frequency clock protein n=1 Tax=Rhodotorula graminis (strain WP1) TaxID=578459 RepID=A0A194S8K1_RHOGW|nr:uncharacterized protein RHOBADRAFT_51883 [Rhodotorula graminis WP1]KPV76899.1 hypothetical protein RHOBADRAFT_51883 [Rhodotorula graminis WP1]